jgi:uncharacterized Fe-S cluster-containing protein
MQNEGRNCGNCSYSKYDKEAEDFVCTNAEVDDFADYVTYNHFCEGWESK